MIQAGVAALGLGAVRGAQAQARPARFVRLMDAIAALNDSTIRRRLEQDGYRIVGSTAEELATLLAAETDKWGAVIRASGIRID